MRVLAIDTALAACAAAVFDTDSGMLAHQNLDLPRGQAEALIPLVAEVMQEAGTDFDAIDRIAVTVGPGSFAGLRVGVAAARGFALAAHKPAVGVTTLAAFAAPHTGATAGAPILAVVDARHGHVYAQVFEADGRPRAAAAYGTVADAVAPLVKTPPVIVGNAARLAADAWPTWNLPAIARPSTAPAIEWVARLGAQADAVAGTPRPFYMKPPNATPQAATPLRA